MKERWIAVPVVNILREYLEYLIREFGRLRAARIGATGFDDWINIQ
jgi:hypothetical protein